MARGADGPAPTPQTTADLTIPKLLVQMAGRYGDRRVAMREKQYGVWRRFTWREYLENVKLLALGFVHLGLERDDKVIIIGHNRPEGLWAEMGAIAAGGVAGWLYQDSLLDEMEYIVNHSDAKFLVCESQEEVDKALAIRDRCPRLRWIAWDDPRGMRGYRDQKLVSLEEVQRLGRELEAREPSRFTELVERGRGDDICFLFYTSGTTAEPKGALLTHRNMLKAGENRMKISPCYETDDYVSFLPFAWIGEQMMSIACGLQAGFTLNFPERPETVWENVREIAPQVIFSPPRVYEQMVRTLQVKHLDAASLKRKIYALGMAIGNRLADRKFSKRPVGSGWKMLGLLADLVLHRKLRDHLGLSRIRDAYTGGAPLGRDHFRFFHAIGVNLKQLYGQTEIAGCSVVHRDNDVKFDTVGTPIPETEVRVTPEGEIISRSPCVFRGYYKTPQETARTLRDGWLYSGDTGFIDEDGHLVVFDRRQDVLTLHDGSRFSPQYLETRLKFSPYIKDAWVIGHEQPFVAAVICIDYGVVGKWADDRGIPYTSYTELAQHPRVYTLVEETVRTANRGLPAAAQIRKFVNLYKEFDADDDELTRTRKLRRTYLETRYKEIVDALYLDMERIAIDSTVTYEDGRVAQIRARLPIATVPREG